MTCIDIKEFLDKEAGFDIGEKCRERTYVVFRSWFYYFCYKYAIDCYTLKYVGQLLNRDHSTVLHSYNRFVDCFPFDIDIQKKTGVMERRLCDNFGIAMVKYDIPEGNKKELTNVRVIRRKENMIESLKDEVSFLRGKIKRRDLIIESQKNRIESLKEKNEIQYKQLYYQKRKNKINT